MLIIFFSLVAAFAAGYFTYVAGEGGHWGWAILAGVAAALVVIVPVNLWIARQLRRIFGNVQSDLVVAQNRIRTKANMMAQRGQGGAKAAAQLEEEMASEVRRILPSIDEARKYRLWNPLAMAQVNLMKGQLLYQIRDYEAARPFLEKALVVDPSILCMRLVLQWKKDPGDVAALDKVFRKNIARFKYEKSTLCYATYSWLLVRQNKLTEAVTLLDEAKKKTGDPVIAQNWEHLANRRMTRFSNAGLGENWYALGLEQPAPVRVSPQDRFGGRPRGGFRR